MKIDKLNKLATERLPGGLGVADARALVKAAGSGATAVKNLKKVLAKFEDKFTAKGKAELKKLIGISDEPTPINDKILPKTKARIMAAVKALDGNWGERLPALSKSAVFAETVIAKPPPGSADMPTTSAMIPIGTFNPAGNYKDPNKVDEFYIKRQGGLALMTFIYGPFKLDASAAVGQVAIHQIDNGRTVEVKKGENLVVALPSNPSTGYRWHVTGTPRSFGHPATTEFLPGATPRALGAGGTEQFTWKTSGMFPKVGDSGQVTMVYSRGEQGEPSQTFTFTVKVV
jgi:inhibitor of cysteine peptidase